MATDIESLHLGVCVCVCVCIHIYICVCIYIHTYIYIFSCTMGTGSFPGVKCGRDVLLNTHPLHGRVELYLYPPSGPHRACNGITLPYI